MSIVRDPAAGRQQVAEVGALLRAGTGHVHLLGIGGIGMAGLALHLSGRGIRVSGCDLSASRVTDWLAGKGIRVQFGHDAAHVENGVDWVVRSTAVPDDCVELQCAASKGLPVYHRGVVLPALLEGRMSVAVTGTHGKTTTSAMIAHVLIACGRCPGYCIGGELESLGGVAAVGDGRTLVVEADESDGTVVFYRPDIGVVTNIEYDHMEHFENEAALFGCFETFGRNTRTRLVYCADDPKAVAVCGTLPGARSYGFGGAASVRGTALEEGATEVSCDVGIRRDAADAVPLGRLTIPVAGRHNALNALGAVVACLDLGIPFEDIRKGLASFRHARRRFETVWQGRGITVISDYAHHPTEIRTVIDTAKRLPHERLIGVFQPHRFTRTRALGAQFPPAFAGVDELVIVPVYAASEKPMEGGTSADLYGQFQTFAQVNTRLLASMAEAWNYLRSILRPGDIFLVIGAGDVEQLAWWARDELARETT